MQLTVSICDQRIDSESYHGFYHASFEADYHHDKVSPETPSTVIIDKINLVHVDYYDDKTESRMQLTHGSISRELKEYVLAHMDCSTLRRKVFDKACSPNLGGLPMPANGSANDMLSKEEYMQFNYLLERIVHSQKPWKEKVAEVRGKIKATILDEFVTWFISESTKEEEEFDDEDDLEDDDWEDDEDDEDYEEFDDPDEDEDD
jgi:hypothetical protein